MQTLCDFIETICERQAPADLCYEASDGTVITCRTRLLAMNSDELLADQPSYRDGERRIPEGCPITVHVSQNGCRFQFDSSIEKAGNPVQINELTRVQSIVLRLPAVITESQRRGHYRVSLAAKDTIVVELARSHPDVPGACHINADVLQGKMVDLSAGGSAVLVDVAVGTRLQVGQQWYLTYCLPDVPVEFCMLGSVQHMRVIEVSDSIRAGFAFRSWVGRRLAVDQRVISRSVADFQRQSLRARG